MTAPPCPTGAVHPAEPARGDREHRDEHEPDARAPRTRPPARSAVAHGAPRASRPPTRRAARDQPPPRTSTGPTRDGKPDERRRDATHERNRARTQIGDAGDRVGGRGATIIARRDLRTARRRTALPSRPRARVRAHARPPRATSPCTSAGLAHERRRECASFPGRGAGGAMGRGRRRGRSRRTFGAT